MSRTVQHQKTARQNPRARRSLHQPQGRRPASSQSETNEPIVRACIVANASHDVICKSTSQARIVCAMYCAWSGRSRAEYGVCPQIPASRRRFLPAFDHGQPLRNNHSCGRSSLTMHALSAIAVENLASRLVSGAFANSTNAFSEDPAEVAVASNGPHPILLAPCPCFIIFQAMTASQDWINYRLGDWNHSPR